MSEKLLRLYNAANKNRLLRAMLTGAAISAGTAYLGNPALCWHAVGVWASAGISGAVLAGINFVRNPQTGNPPEPTPPEGDKP